MRTQSHFVDRVQHPPEKVRTSMQLKGKFYFHHHYPMVPSPPAIKICDWTGEMSLHQLRASSIDWSLKSITCAGFRTPEIFERFVVRRSIFKRVQARLTSPLKAFRNVAPSLLPAFLFPITIRGRQLEGILVQWTWNTTLGFHLNFSHCRTK